MHLNGFLPTVSSSFLQPKESADFFAQNKISKEILENCHRYDSIVNNRSLVI